MNYAFLIAYRARPPQEFRKQELEALIENIRAVMARNPRHTYKIWVGEQDDDKKFNRGWLLNAIFNEAAREDETACFIHVNTDYQLPVAELPGELEEMPEGFLDLHGYPLALGAFCAFSARAYRACNGFPNDLWGWGGDDWAIWKRIELAGLKVDRPGHLYNRWILEGKEHVRDESNNAENITKALDVTGASMMQNGANTAAYWISRSSSPGVQGDVRWRSFQQPKHFLVTGGAGFIGSHLVDELCRTWNRVEVIDSLRSGFREQVSSRASFVDRDIRSYESICQLFDGKDGVFHLAAIARTPWCIEDPILCYQTNVMGTLHVCEAARQAKVPRVVLSSSNVVYAFMTPYRTGKEAGEGIGTTYADMYGQSVISLRYSNVYGPRQSETGPSPNVFAALRKSRRDEGRLVITGDGEQTRDFTHVSDIVQGNLAAMRSRHCGVVDLCTGKNWSLNQVAKWFGGEIRYTDERPGDVKHIVQNPEDARLMLGWEAKVSLVDGIRDVLPEVSLTQAPTA
jgi:UDP-glucose 4-epimerase